MKDLDELIQMPLEKKSNRLLKLALAGLCLMSFSMLMVLENTASGSEEAKKAPVEAKKEEVIPKKESGETAKDTPHGADQKKESGEDKDASKAHGKSAEGEKKAEDTVQSQEPTVQKIVIENIEDLKEPIQANLVTKEGSLYVDLAREIEISERDRSKIEGLKSQTSQVKVFEQELKNRLNELNGLQDQLSGKTQTVGGALDKQSAGNENLKLLVSLYESISADQAAELLKRLPVTVSVTMIQMMNPKKSSKIIAAMDTKSASELSQLLIRMPLKQDKGAKQ